MRETHSPAAADSTSSFFVFLAAQSSPCSSCYSSAPDRAIPQAPTQGWGLFGPTSRNATIVRKGNEGMRLSPRLHCRTGREVTDGVVSLPTRRSVLSIQYLPDRIVPCPGISAIMTPGRVVVKVEYRRAGLGQKIRRSGYSRCHYHASNQVG